MADLGHETIELCTGVLKRISADLNDENEVRAVNSLMAWLNCCQMENELLEAEEKLDDLSRQYLLTYRNKLNNRNYLASSVRGPPRRASTKRRSSMTFLKPDDEDTDWLGPLDEWSERLLHETILPDTVPTWEYSQELEEEMNKLYSWDDFNVFRVAVLTNGHPLEVVAMKVIKDLGLITELNLDEEKFRSFVRAAEVTYHPDNKYHNNIHAADVTQSLSVLLSFKEMRSQLSHLEQLAIFLAAVSHDMGHPGLNNDFLINSGSEEAKIYHDRSVNENMHLRYTFKLLEREENNFVCNLSRQDWWFLRHTLIKAILNTDMAVHTSLLSEFENHIAMDGTNLANWPLQHRTCALAMFVHCADIANPAKPGPFARAWTWRVMQEFYDQGDKERELDISISPACVRGKVNVPRSQLTFLQFCVRPSYEALAHLFPEVAQSPLAHIDESMKHWERQIANRAVTEKAAAENGVQNGSPLRVQKT